MFGSLDILRMAQSYAAHAATRQQAIAQNVANADTPGYRARDTISFAEYWDRSDGGRVALARFDGVVREEANPITMSPDGNSVSLENEMMRGVDARQQHEMALGVYSSVRDLMRAVIGR